MSKAQTTLNKIRMMRFYKTRLLAWYREVFMQNADQYFCCTGHECGCMGVSYGSYWKYRLGDLPKPEAV